MLISDDNEIVAGLGRVLAAKELGVAAVPTVKLSHLSADERWAHLRADNKLALNAAAIAKRIDAEPEAAASRMTPSSICWTGMRSSRDSLVGGLLLIGADREGPAAFRPKIS